MYCCFYLGTMLVIMPSTFLLGLVGAIDTNESLTFPITKIVFFSALIISIYTYYRINRLDKQLLNVREEDTSDRDKEIINEYNLEHD